MTFLELKTEVFALLGDTIADPKLFTEDEVGRYINDTIRRMAYESGCLEIRHQVDLEAGVGVYDLPANIDRIFRVTYDQERIAATSTHELDRYERGWQDTQGLVQAYYQDRIEHDQIGVWRIPESGFNVAFDQELDTLVEIEDLTVNMRFESAVVSLGTVVDFEQTGDTVVFAAAASGGGGDADYGIVVDISSDDTSDSYSLSADLGVIVDADDTSDATFDAEIFIQTLPGGTDGENTATTEYGIVTDVSVSDGSDTYIMDSEFGVVIDWNDPSNNLEIWAKEDPVDLDADGDVPRLPAHAHMGIAFGAAGKALLKNAETRNPGLAAAYLATESEYTTFLRRLVVRRTPERRRQMREQNIDYRTARRYPRLPGEYPRTLH